MIKCLLKKIAIAMGVFVSFAMMPSIAMAVSASPGVFQVKQPDGTIFNAVAKGDEWGNWTETEAGYTVAEDANKTWRYVKGYTASTGVPLASQIDDQPVLSNTPANLAPWGVVQKHLKPAKKSPQSNASMLAPSVFQAARIAGGPSRTAYGNSSGSLLYILVQFTDRAGITSPTADWAPFVNQVSTYYSDVSHGKAIISPASETYGTPNDGVIGWLNIGYAHPNTRGSIGVANKNLSRDAIIAADPFINYASFDANGDGFVDSDELAVVIIPAGYDTSYGGTASALAPSVWGHKWSISPSPAVDGVKVGDYHYDFATGVGRGGYAQFGENMATSAANQHLSTLGLHVHELGHLIFGWPDLYDYDGSSSGIGGFGLMGGGSWGKKNADAWGGATPVPPSAWSRYNRGWVTPVTALGTMS